MNERILEFAQRAGLISHFNVAPHRPDIERFAELLIRECAQHLTNIGQDYCREQIEKHFGVES